MTGDTGSGGGFATPSVSGAGIYATETVGGVGAPQPDAAGSGASGGGTAAAGSAGPGFEIDTAAVRAQAAVIAECGVQAANVLNRLRAGLEAAGEPWGTEDLGKQFGHSYTGPANKGFAAMSTLGDALAAVADGLVSHAQTYERVEEAASRAFTKVAAKTDGGAA